jgi:hypothetical protein
VSADPAIGEQFRIQVAKHYGALVALAQGHPHSGLIEALDVRGGLTDWEQHHRPQNVAEEEQ